MESKILSGKELSKFCKEINIREPHKILLKTNENQAEYYNSNDNCYHKIDINIAKKYI